MRDLPRLASLRMADVLELHPSILSDLQQLHSLQVWCTRCNCCFALQHAPRLLRGVVALSLKSTFIATIYVMCYNFITQPQTKLIHIIQYIQFFTNIQVFFI